MIADLQVATRGDGEVGLLILLPVELVGYIAAGGDMADKRAMVCLDREQALVVADEIRQAALA